MSCPSALNPSSKSGAPSNQESPTEDVRHGGPQKAGGESKGATELTHNRRG